MGMILWRFGWFPMSLWRLHLSGRFIGRKCHVQIGPLYLSVYDSPEQD